MADLTQLQLYSETPGFKNNNIYTGSVTIPSSPITGNGTVESYAYVNLSTEPDIIDAMFNCATVEGIDGAPNLGISQWFKPGVHLIRQNGSGVVTELFTR